MDLLAYESVQSREENDNLKNRIDKIETLAHSALKISKRNEQYSRKSKIKIMGVKEVENENEEGLIKQLNNILRPKSWGKD